MDFHVGDLAIITATFVDANGANIDPDTVKVMIKAPDKTVTTYTYGVGVFIVRDDVGIYHIRLSLTQENNWFYRFEGTGLNQSGNEGTIHVVPSEFY